MKQKILCLIVLCLPLLLMAQSFDSAQDDKGIKWSTGLTWQQVKKKAKKENKYIFVDCFATWCKPCKEMDMKVYTVDSVYDYLNAGFISVKVQMDVTKNDAAATKSWYKTASYMNKEYNLTAYPTLLFFTPSGEVATKEVGYKDPGSFITAARNSKDPSKQYYVLLKNYKKGKLDDAAKRSLIYTAKQLGDTVNYYALRNSYFAYLHALPKGKLYTKENIEFIASIISRRSQPVFDMFYPAGIAVDKVMQKEGFAKNVVDQVIMNEKVAPVVNPALETKVEPDWSSLYNSIAKDYKGNYADRNVLLAKLEWYYYTQNDWLKYAKALNDKIEKFGTDTTDRAEEFKLNNKANWIWEHVGNTKPMSNEDIKELSRTCAWMEGVVRRGATGTGFRLQQWPLYMDTYANLLHKLGRTAEAIKWEEFAILKAKELGGDGADYLEYYQGCLDKMKKGEANWPIVEKK